MRPDYSPWQLPFETKYLNIPQLWTGKLKPVLRWKAAMFWTELFPMFWCRVCSLCNLFLVLFFSWVALWVCVSTGFSGGKGYTIFSKTFISSFKTVKIIQLVNTKTRLNIKVVSAEVSGLTPKPDFQICPFVVPSRVTA